MRAFVSFKTKCLLWRKLIPSVLLNCPFIYVLVVSLFHLISIASGGQAEAFQIAPIKKKKKPRYGEEFKGSLHQCILSVVVFLRILYRDRN